MPGGLLPYMGYMGRCSPKRVGFSATLVVNRVWFQQSSPEILGMFLGRSYFFIMIKKRATKAHATLIMFRVTVPAAKVINRVSNFWPGHK